MQQGIGHFVRRILGIHLLLLVLLLMVVTLAAHRVYQTAKTQAMEQAQIRQTRLVEQTAHGVGAFYDSILSDLGLLKPDESETDLPNLPEQTPDVRPLANLNMFRLAAGAVLTRQLQGRAYLYLVNDQMRPHALGTDERSNKPTTKPAKMRNFPLPPALPNDPVFEAALMKAFGPWLKRQDGKAISGLQIIENDGVRLAIKLVCVPFKAPAKDRWLVAAVSARPIEHNYLEDLVHDDVDPGESALPQGAFLVDESMTIMASSRHELVGTQLNASSAPELNALLPAFRSKDFNTTQTLPNSFRIGDRMFEPALVTASPVNPQKVLGKQWFVLVSSPLTDVDRVVRELSHKALFWAIFVAVSMTAILVSTAAQLIFSRLKMERLRHQALQNEMRQARQIQLAWLPQKTKTMCSASTIDIASLNRPATHISGDFYNFFELADGRMAVVIGDVTGHGTAAAFLMATTQLLIRNMLPQYADPGRCMEEVNRQLANQVFNGQFVTMQILLIDPRTGEVVISTAGHPAPLVSDGDSFHSLKLEPQLVAGVDGRIQYPTERFRLKPGASLLLYTDGVVETEDPAGRSLGLEGFRSGLSGKITTAEALLQRAVSTVNNFRKGRDLRDDLTMVAVHLLPVATPKVAPTPTPQLAAPAVREVPARVGPIRADAPKRETSLRPR